MNLQWWCAAQGEPWTWSWQPYPGVWLVVAAVLALGWWLGRFRVEDASGEGDPRWGRAAWIAGVVLLWLALDWPLGPLGASYLASVHMVQYLMVGLVAPALFLLGVPPGAWEALRRHRKVTAFLRDVANPLAAMVFFNVGMTLSHWPSVVDGLRVSQLGSFGLDLLWIVCGLIFWWPLVAPVPGFRRFHPVFKVGYLFVNGVVLTPPALMLLFSEHPLYAVYELAPPITFQPVIWDQQLAGAIMKIGSAVIMGVGICFVAWRWYLDETEGNGS